MYTGNMAFADGSKEEEKRLLSLKENALSKIKQLGPEDIKQLPSIINHFFSDFFNSKTRMTFEEIKDDMKKKKVGLKTREEIWEFFEHLLEIEYAEKTISSEEFKKITDQFQTIINGVMSEIMFKKKLQSGSNSFIHKTKSAESKNAEVTKERIEIKKDFSIVEIFDMVHKARIHLKNGEKKEAREVYSKILSLYSKLSSPAKKEVYFHITKLYEKF